MNSFDKTPEGRLPLYSDGSPSSYGKDHSKLGHKKQLIRKRGGFVFRVYEHAIERFKNFSRTSLAIERFKNFSRTSLAIERFKNFSRTSLAIKRFKNFSGTSLAIERFKKRTSLAIKRFKNFSSN
ncbi:hypothetical protein SDJN02_24932 [Cucurbita argyrosperma subsp. argyrosperma]|nr:hypothetical protein SDJN02_24932 [Cucurbita argyrosperma subsp. argyrosperma]